MAVLTEDITAEEVEQILTELKTEHWSGARLTELAEEIEAAMASE